VADHAEGEAEGRVDLLVEGVLELVGLARGAHEGLAHGVGAGQV